MGRAKLEEVEEITEEKHEEKVLTLEELLEIYPGLTLENAALLQSAHALSKKLAA